MPKITATTFKNFPFYEYASHAVITRGRRYFREGRVYDISYEGERAVCQVEGNYDDYQVIIRLKQNNKASFSCTCPHAQQVPVCKHIIASVLTLTRQLQEDPAQVWENKITIALEKLSSKQKKKKQYYALFLLTKNEFYSEDSFELIPVIVRKSKWKIPASVKEKIEHPNDIFIQDFAWTNHTQTPYHPINAEACLNLSAEEILVFNMLLQEKRYYNNVAFSAYLPLLAQSPIFYMGKEKVKKYPLKIRQDPITLKAALIQKENTLNLEAGASFNDKLYTSAKDNIEIIAKDPAWALLGDTLLPIKNPAMIDMLASLPITIPTEEEEKFRAEYLPKLAQSVPLESDIISWEDVRADAVPRLYLRKERDELVAELRFGYGAHETRAERKPATVKLAENPDSWTLTRIHRQPERELALYDQIKGKTFGLKRSRGKNLPYGSFLLRANTHPYDFLTKHISALTEAGFEIYGDKESLGKINKNSPSISLNISSGIDWFDLDITVNYGEQTVKLNEIRKALKNGFNYIKLADGSVGQIPEKWLERYKHLFNMTKETEDGFRVRDYQLAMVDELLEDANEQEIAAEFYKKRERLKNLKEIKEYPVPKGFKGELRPYQKAGLNWLYFLREYGFGGILADDMGLGKTIQMLAFLQSLRENAKNGHHAAGFEKQAQTTSATLLVVPKSLITNWQREAASFTPDLRILKYLGSDRDKDVSIFDEYDIIITTYGTMLRDVEILRTYRFDTVVLDESQAIKNPLAKTSKAARLLNAKYRMAMTGTPVENNTFELWSQFAFLNPGLLGNMSYFKREFATPIETKNDTETTALLKRMVFPFILRRTKRQVAPELPPRTERIIYTDLHEKQRELYDRTREQYRSQLLGLLDEKGMDQTRMQILEGLLRLRQICIHPALMEPTYQDQAAKFEILLDTLKTLKAEGHKALIFSQFVETLKLLEKEMKKEKFKYTYLDGKTRKRQARVDAFQNDDSLSFFLISLKAGGVGLNLTAADYVIHLDPWWNPAVEMQAADRAHRIGQDNPVFVYKFIARDTVEEKILALQERKKELVDQLITSEGSFFKSLSRDDVDVLFS